MKLSPVSCNSVLVEFIISYTYIYIKFKNFNKKTSFLFHSIYHTKFSLNMKLHCSFLKKHVKCVSKRVRRFYKYSEMHFKNTVIILIHFIIQQLFIQECDDAYLTFHKYIVDMLLFTIYMKWQKQIFKFNLNKYVLLKSSILHNCS